MGVQALAASIVAVYVFVVSFILLKLIGVFMPLQKPMEKLKIGDEAIHGEIGFEIPE